MIRPLSIVQLLLVAGIVACRSSTAHEVATTPAPQLRPIPMYQIAPGGDSSVVEISRVESGDPLAQITSTKRITLTATGADARTILLWLAQQAGASLVISPDVHARVSVTFHDAPVVEAMRAILAEAGLSVLQGPPKSPWPAVVFYQLPLNVELASAEAIAARFGVSLDVARFIVENRPKP